MYHKAYGIMETLAPLHVGASAGEESGNLNLIFRDQFTQTGIVPGSSIRGRFRADMRSSRQLWLEDQLTQKGVTLPDPQLKTIKNQSGKEFSRLEWLEQQAKTEDLTVPIDENYWYGHHTIGGQKDGGTTEALVKFEYASLVWLPVFCPGQPVVWVTCPRLLRRYKQITSLSADIPLPYTAPKGLGREVETGKEQTKKGPGGPKVTRTLFFNLGFLTLEHTADLTAWIPTGVTLDPKNLVVLDDNDMAMVHDMALYRQSRVKLLDGMKKVDTEKGAFFNVEALPEGSILIFPVALKQEDWKPFGVDSEEADIRTSELYFGGLESIGFGRCRVTLQVGA